MVLRLLWCLAFTFAVSFLVACLLVATNPRRWGKK